MGDDDTFELRPVGHVSSSLTDAATAPRQGDEGAPEAWLVLDDDMAGAAEGLEAGMDVLVLTWLDRADRSVRRVYPRGDTSRPETGVFATRSPHRPNPIGLHRVHIVERQDLRLRVAGLEALDGTPVLDVKPLLAADPGER
jgi:tRNA-Thr(GGU) m(6)t(6)A37 methyltransferase TsaA